MRWGVEHETIPTVQCVLICAREAKFMSSRLMMVIAIVVMPILAAAKTTSSWTVLPMANRGVDTNVAVTFSDLLATELGNRTMGKVVRGSKICLDVPCAVEGGQNAATRHVIYGQISALGTKLIVTMSAVDVAAQRLMSSHKIRVDRIEDLDIAANRLIVALLDGEPVSRGARLGQITAEEAKPDRRMAGDHGFTMGLGGHYLGLDTMDRKLGTTLGLGYWFETPNFSFEPTIAFTSNFADARDGAYGFLDFGLLVHYVLRRGNISPLFGAGLKMRNINVQREQQIDLGSTLLVEGVRQLDETSTGLALAGRAGLLLFGNYETRVLAQLTYEGAFVGLTDATFLSSLAFGLSIIF
ncbi:MAG: hypothetical protein VX589_02660 [Myxococcota bacterium]|nr:hypothetical protein [Myxococcota bacterium]